MSPLGFSGIFIANSEVRSIIYLDAHEPRFR
jgi:hypothetical protein